MFNRYSKNYYCKRNRCLQNNDINKNTLEQMMSQGAILLDVRSRQEYREGHLNNAIQIADFELRDKVEDVLKDKDATIIVYCQSGNRSRNACNLLKRMGYKNIYNLYGGLNEL